MKKISKLRNELYTVEKDIAYMKNEFKKYLNHLESLELDLNKSKLKAIDLVGQIKFLEGDKNMLGDADIPRKSEYKL